MIIGMSLLYSYVMSYLHISQAAAGWIVGLQLSKWLLLLAILLLVVMLGFFLPPVSIILMTAPIILPPLRAAGFDLIWFGVVMAVVMEMGLIHPPVGLNIFVINRIAPDIGLGADHLGHAAVRGVDGGGGGDPVRSCQGSRCGYRTWFTRSSVRGERMVSGMPALMSQLARPPS